MQGTGLKLKHFKEPNAEVWPEAWPAVDLFRTSLSSQWRCGAGGPIGLDHMVVFHHLDRLGIHGAEQEDFMGIIDTIETAALVEIRKE